MSFLSAVFSIMNKQRLVILSDLWGCRTADWLSYYTNTLTPFFDIKIYDSCHLGGVKTAERDEQTIHRNFIESGIESAVENLLLLETQKVCILGFSVGGYIAWKAATKGLPVSYLCAVSSTRLRLEIRKPPTSKMDLFFAENDIYKPDNAWFDFMQIEKNIFKNELHNCYIEKPIATAVCERIMQNTK
jgi:hypothetical protein